MAQPGMNTGEAAKPESSLARLGGEIWVQIQLAPSFFESIAGKFHSG